MASDLACPLAAERRRSCRAPTAAAWAGKREPAPRDPKEMNGNDRGKNICVLSSLAQRLSSKDRLGLIIELGAHWAFD